MRTLKLLFLLFIGSFAVHAQNYPSAPLNYVTDMAEVLDEEQEATLNQKLKAFEDSTSNQIFVYIGQSLNGEVMSELCQEIFHKWKIGEEKKDNGVLIAVFIDDHKFRIHTGYGLEGALPDVLTKKIQDTEMKPHFKNNDYYTGLNNGIDKLIYYSAHEYSNEQDNNEWHFSDYIFAALFGYFMNAVFLFINLFSLYKLAKNKNKSKRFKNLVLLLCIFLFLLPCIGGVILFILMFFIGEVKKVNTRGTGSLSSSDSDSNSSSWNSSDSSSDFDGGGGGDSGGGGSDSDW